MGSIHALFILEGQFGFNHWPINEVVASISNPICRMGSIVVKVLSGSRGEVELILITWVVGDELAYVNLAPLFLHNMLW